MPLNNPLSLSSRGGRSNARPFFSQIFVDGLPPWESDRETSYFGDASGRRFIREIFPFALSSLSLSLGTKRDNGIVAGFVAPLSTPSYFDFSRFKYCTMYILWFARREKGGNMYFTRIFYFYTDTPCLELRLFLLEEIVNPSEGYKNLEEMKSDRWNRMDGS